MDPLVSGVLAGVTSGSVMAAVLGFVLSRRTEMVKREVEVQFERLNDTFRSQRAWKERSISELLGPVCIQLERTKRAYARWSNKNLFLEAKVIKEGNLAVRDMFLKYPHLIPPELLEQSSRLIEHYDRWLEEFEKIRQAEKPDLNTRFVFVGPAGYRFPSDAEQKFQEVYRSYWRELYGELPKI